MKQQNKKKDYEIIDEQVYITDTGLFIKQISYAKVLLILNNKDKEISKIVYEVDKNEYDRFWKNKKELESKE